MKHKGVKPSVATSETTQLRLVWGFTHKLKTTWPRANGTKHPSNALWIDASGNCLVGIHECDDGDVESKAQPLGPTSTVSPQNAALWLADAMELSNEIGSALQQGYGFEDWLRLVAVMRKVGLTKSTKTEQAKKSKLSPVALIEASMVRLKGCDIEDEIIARQIIAGDLTVEEKFAAAAQLRRVAMLIDASTALSPMLPPHRLNWNLN